MSEQPGSRWAYRPHLDGLRAVAVYLVVAFHAGAYQLSGGFIGVDVFFVLSGFLVTGLLVRDLEEEGGRIRLGRFYARRVRRLLPAALVTLVATAVVFRTIGTPVELDDAADAIRAAALYVANWHFISQATDYFADDVAQSPVLHFWSLSIEEQFYLLWPLAFLGLHRLTRRARRWGRRALQAGIAGLGLASVAAALTLASSSPDRAYFGTDTRAYQLLAGALLAVSPGVVTAVGRLAARGATWRRAVSGAALAGLAAIVALATPLLEVGPVSRGVLVTALTCATLVALEASTGGLARWALSLRPVTYLGQISYGTYLWHWIVILLLGHHAELSARTTAVVAAVVATGIASLSFQVLESPIRFQPRLDRYRRPVIATGIALSLLVGLLVAPRILDEPVGTGGPLAADGTTVSGDVPDGATLFAAFRETFDYDSCPFGEELCVLAEGDGPTAVIVGDSHAAVWTSTLIDLAERHDMTLLGALPLSCPWPRGIRYQSAQPTCPADQAVIYDELIPAADPDIVFLANRAFGDPNHPRPVVDVDRGVLDGPEREAAVGERAGALVDELLADGRAVVIFEPLPIAPEGTNPFQCLNWSRDAAACRFIASPAPTAEDRVLRAVAADRDGVVSIDADLLACPYLPICDPVVSGLVVRRDADHLAREFARSLAGPIDDFLVAQGVLER